ncbi:MAG TPA: PadR family transcriptional regulator [Nitrososphaerales archaeon]|nr:PadR family transcriptional regulator [Nitrososphaerales archaeon]
MFNWSFNYAKRTHRGLRHWVVYLLQDSPKNGVEIMDALESMSRGWWRPSPGSVYPLLEAMAREGTIKKNPDNRYELTEAGRKEAEWPGQFPGMGPRSVQDILVQMSGFVSYLEDISKTDASKVKESSDKIKELGNRLGKLGGS